MSCAIRWKIRLGIICILKICIHKHTANHYHYDRHHQHCHHRHRHIHCDCHTDASTHIVCSNGGYPCELPQHELSWRCVASTRVKEPLHFTMDFHFEIAQNKFIPQNFNSIRIDRFRGWPFVCPEAIHRMTVLADVCCDRRCGLVALSKMRTRDLEIFRNGSIWQNIAMSMKVLVSSEIFKWSLRHFQIIRNGILIIFLYCFFLFETALDEIRRKRGEGVEDATRNK